MAAIFFICEIHLYYVKDDRLYLFDINMQILFFPIFSSRFFLKATLISSNIKL